MSLLTIDIEEAYWAQKKLQRVDPYQGGCVVQVEVANTGKRDGEEVVQVYLKNPKDTDGPLKTLRAYQRVSLKAGETKTIAIYLEGDQLLWWNKASNTMQPMNPGDYEVEVQ